MEIGYKRTKRIGRYTRKINSGSGKKTKMIEFIKHALGLCGEGHPSMIWLMAGGSTMLYYLKHNITWCWKRGCDICKAKIKNIKA
jgi:hypothetical protein